MNVEIMQSLKNSPIIAVIRRPPPDKIIEIAKALSLGGVKHLEITIDQPSSYHIIERLKQELKNDVYIGAGTVLDEVTAVQAIQAGADFIFSPILNYGVIQAAKRHGVLSIPGVYTPTEAATAYEYGADIVKIFPAETLGPKYLKLLKAPLPHISMIPTGGINEGNLNDFLASGALAVGIGGNLVDEDAINRENFKILTHKAEHFFSIINNK